MRHKTPGDELLEWHNAIRGHPITQYLENRMTTIVKLHINGRYYAEVKQDGVKDIVTVHGNYDGSPNPSGSHTFNLVHGSIGNKFVVSEYQVPESTPKVEAPETQTIEGKDVGDLNKVLGIELEAGKASVTQDTSDLKADFTDKT